jgi:hypothetical protein
MLTGPFLISSPWSFSALSAFSTSAPILSHSTTAALKSLPIARTATDTRAVSGFTGMVALPLTVIFL